MLIDAVFFLAPHPTSRQFPGGARHAKKNHFYPDSYFRVGRLVLAGLVPSRTSPPSHEPIAVQLSQNLPTSDSTVPNRAAPHPRTQSTPAGRILAWLTASARTLSTSLIQQLVGSKLDRRLSAVLNIRTNPILSSASSELRRSISSSLISY